MQLDNKIVITGAAGLVGQNLVLMLREQGFKNIIAIDKHHKNLELLKTINPEITPVLADISEEGSWMTIFQDTDYVIMLHAQITGLYSEEFVKNNIKATEKVIQVIQHYNIPYTVHISSSVVNSVANDDYTQTKICQEELVLASQIPCCVLRPTLMFGWFDPKHFGWLSRFMEQVPIFPIPGHGRYLRQPLYSRDFCKIILAAMTKKPLRQVFDIIGQEQIYYIDIIKLIKKTKQCHTPLIKIPYSLFHLLLKIYAIFNKNPPFTATQLKALTAGDFFTGIDAKQIFGITMTTLKQAIEETFTHPIYSKININE